MSIGNIKELFSERVKESFTFNNVEDSNNIPDKNGGNNKEEEGELFTSIEETEVGIVEYLNDCKGFNAVIKERFSDFHVHEIDLDGNIARLTNTEIPVVKATPVNEDIISNDNWEKLKSLHDKVIESVEIDVTDFNKEQRKDIHKAIKFKYGSEFISNTIEADDKKTLVVSLGRDSTRTDPWFSELGKYLHFVLFKTNKDTVDAINVIASKLRTKPSYWTYAGTKDKRAKTSQWVSMWHLDAKRLNGINNSLRDMKVGNYVYKDTPLKLGDLKGNLFEIALRNVTESDEVINNALNSVKDNGFINYFGLQRFGSCVEVPTYEIGKALILGDFRLAIELILKPRRGKMRHDLREARKVWWETRDADKAYKCLRSKDRTIEGKLLLGLTKHGKNAYVNALDCIPRNVRLLYLHSYQSLIWNKVLSRRIKEFGKTVIEGDLVYTEGGKIVESEEESLANKVKSLSKEETNSFGIYDILHPLPGHNVIYPNNVIKEWYEELLKEDDLTSEKLKQTVKQYSLSGTHRHIVKKVKDLSWYICHYSDPEEDLILSDLDKLNDVSLEINKNLDDKYKAVVLKFSLDSSTYATMALREILKIDTSVSYHATLNGYSSKRAVEECDDKSRKKSKV